MTSRLMSDAEIRRRKKLQSHISTTTGTLGLAALTGTALASRGGRNTLRRIPQLKGRIKAPPPKDPNRDKIKGAVTPILATSAGIGGVGAFNFAGYTSAESRKRKLGQPASRVKKDWEEPMEMGYFGEEGRPVKLPEIKVPVEKAWSPSASNFDSEARRHKRSKTYEGAALAGAGAGGAATAHYGLKTVQATRKLGKPVEAALKVGETATGRPRYGGTFRALDVARARPAAKAAGKTGAAAAVVGGSILAHKKIKERRHGSWQSYAKRATTSAFGVDHTVSKAINIKPENEGKFTASAKKAGKGIQEHAHAVVNSSKATELQRKRAQFAINAKKWKH